MKARFLITAVAPLALLAGCGDQSAVDDNAFAADTGMNDTMPLDDNGMATGMGTDMAAMPTQQFVDTMAASDAYEIAAGKLAQEKAASQALKDFGAKMVADHSDSTAKLKSAAAAAPQPITPDPAMTPEQQGNLDALRAASGEAFDTAYKTQQVAAHEKALSALQGYAASGDMPEIKSWASTTAPIVQGHLEMIRGM